ncbi:hypothetical protein [uncultured Sphingomonas sp.]|uniref:hypothetical protein n=1 Tax=uncultured Sphingomonas sp. TaxID=158754 RepID=UPI0035CB6445
MWKTILSALALALLPATAVAADRVELPVRAVTLSDGTHRFGVTLTIDGRPIEAGLDTGSTGLRVMARGLPGSTAKGSPTRYFYAVGTQFEGEAITLPIALGSVSGSVKIQRIDRLSCTAAKPDCPVRRNDDPATFGIQGNGLPDEGFVAILGVNFRRDVVPNPFEALGVRQWIVELPRPGDPAPGRIVLNPTPADLEGYRRYRLLDDDNSLAGCLSGAAPLGRTCGPATIDSGAPGLRVVAASPHRPVPPGTPATLTLGDGHDQASMDIETDRREQASHLTFEQRPDIQATRLFFGISPYFHWSVFYDAEAHMIGLRPR